MTAMARTFKEKFCAFVSQVSHAEYTCIGEGQIKRRKGGFLRITKEHFRQF